MVLLLGFAVLLLGSRGIDELLHRARQASLAGGPRRTVALRLAVALALVLLATGGAVALEAPGRSAPVRQAFHEAGWLMVRLGVMGLALLLVRLAWLSVNRAVAIIALTLLVEAFSYAHGYNPVLDLNTRYPAPTGGIRYLQANQGSASTLFLGGTLPPDLPTVYHIRDLRVYDALEPREHLQIMERLFHPQGQRQSIDFIPTPDLLAQAAREGLHIRFVAAGGSGILAEPLRQAYPAAIVYVGPDFVIARVGE